MGADKKTSNIITALKEDLIYDYVASNYYEMTKEELFRLCLEVLYAMSVNMDRYDYQRALDEAANELVDMWLE